MKSRRFTRWLLLLLAIVLVASGCAMPPEDLSKAATNLPAEIKSAQKANDDARRKFGELLKQQKYAFIAAYPATDQHVDRFDQAKTKLDEANKTYASKVKTVLDDYDDKKQSALRDGISLVQGQIGEAKALTAEPATWLDKVVATQADSAGVLRQAATQISSIKAATEPFKADASNPIAKTLLQRHDDALKAYGLLQAASAKSPPNFAAMTTNAIVVADNAAALTTETQTLIDIKVDSFVEISRTSWYEGGDTESTTDYDYPPVAVDPEAANYFAKFPVNEVLATDGYGGFKTTNADRKQWDKLKINSTQDRPKGHDTSEFYFGGVEDLICHAVRVLVNGKPSASRLPKPEDNACAKYNTPEQIAQGVYWLEADELRAEDIGMDIYSKGLGDLEAQATDEATPPGMVYVGDPSTGEWQTDSSGNSFWVFYGQYRLFSDLIGGPYPGHYRSEYDDWNRNCRYNHCPYYGNMGGGQPRYGMKSPMAQARFPHSNYVKTGLYNSSLRGAGPAARGGGPSGSGK